MQQWQKNPSDHLLTITWSKNKDDNHRLTIRILSRNHFRFQWLAGEASRVLSTHPELVVGALVELGGYSLRILAEASHLGPVVVVALRLLDDVVEDVATSVVFGCLPCQRALVSKDIRDLDRSAWGTWAIWNGKEDKLKWLKHQCTTYMYNYLRPLYSQ